MGVHHIAEALVLRVEKLEALVSYLYEEVKMLRMEIRAGGIVELPVNASVFTNTGDTNKPADPQQGQRIGIEYFD